MRKREDYTTEVNELLLRSAKKDEQSFKKLVKICSPKLYGVLISILRDAEAAQDCLQEVLLKIWARAESYDDTRGTAMSWMIQISRNHAIDILRARKRRAHDLGSADSQIELPDYSPTAEKRLTIRDDIRKLISCFEKIDKKKSNAIRLAYIRGLSYDELAKVIDAPLNTVRTWLRRGLIDLKDCVDG